MRSDDGPTKTVYSYERMAFDFASSFERHDHHGSIDRHVLRLDLAVLSLVNEEGTPFSGFAFRNRFAFSRG